MKKSSFFLLLAAVCCFSFYSCNGCSSSNEDNSDESELSSLELKKYYDEGYDKGKHDALYSNSDNPRNQYNGKISDEYENGYEKGYHDGIVELNNRIDNNVSDDYNYNTSHETVPRSLLYSVKKGTGNTFYHYQFEFSGNVISWTVSGCEGNRSGQFTYDTDIDINIIEKELNGLVEYQYVRRTLGLGEENEIYLQMAVGGLEKAIDEFGSVRQYCPRPYNELVGLYRDVKACADGEYDILGQLEHIFNNKPAVCGLYNYNFLISQF